MNQLNHLYSVSKTLRFELKPQGKTEEYLNKTELLENDRVRSESYKEVKKIMDRYHACFINESLKEFRFSDELMNEYYELSSKKRSDEENTSFDEIKKLMRQNIVTNGFLKRRRIYFQNCLKKM